MSDDNTVELNTKALDSIIRVLKQKSPVARVGVLGDKNQRTELIQDRSGKINTHSLSNATIGAAHEYGTSVLSQRSFLRVPLNEFLNKAVEKSGFFKEETLKEVIKAGSFTIWMKKIAIIAEGIVIGAFGTNGYGKWKAHKPGYTNRTGKILVDTDQLRDSITSDVE